MTEGTFSTRDWWESIEPGSRVELGFVGVDLAGSTDAGKGLREEQIVARQAEFVTLVETLAEGFDAVRPLAWQGDGVMIFVGATPSGVESPPAATRAATNAGLLAVTLVERLFASGFTARVAAHAGSVVFQADTGRMKSPDIDRAGHLEHDCPAGAAALSEEVYLALPEAIRRRCAYLGTTVRDGTVAFVFPGSAASRRDDVRFVPLVEDPEPVRQRFVRYVQSGDIARLRYVGFRLSRREPPSLDLLEVFTPLDVEGYAPAPALPDVREDAVESRHVSSRHRPRPRPDDALGEAPWASLAARGTSPRPFTDVFRRRRHLVVLGGPGSGKSTLLRWLAIIAASGRAACRGRLGTDERLLPVLVSISRLFELRESLRSMDASGEAPSVLDVLGRYFHERNAGEDVSDLTAFLRGRLEAGDCLVLLDDLDEVPTGRRRDVTAWIESFASAYRENRFVVTSRVFGFAGLDLPGGAAIVVRPFSDAQARQFISAWHRAYRAWEGNLSPEAAALEAPFADADAERLSEVILAEPRLHGLAANPFLLSAMALVHRAEGQLPASRVQLYDIFARALCETWSNARRTAAPPSSAAARIDYEAEAIPILGRLAFWLHERHPAGAAPEEDVKAEIASALVEWGTEQSEAERSARVFLGRASEDLQIIVPRGPGLFGFLHLTFQEFFAAAYLHAREIFEIEAKRRWIDPRWEEVILLGVGMLAILQKRAAAAGVLVRKILSWKVRRYPFLTEVLARHVLLAAKCCADAPNLEARVYSTVVQRFLSMLLEQRYSVIEERGRLALARMRGTRFGDLLRERLVTVLREDESWEVRGSAAAALGALGDPRAVEPLMESLRKDRDSFVRDQAAEALGALGDPRAVEPLLVALRSDPDDDMRWDVASALGALRDPRALEPLLVMLREASSEIVRAQAASALGDLGNAGALDPLLIALRTDPHGEVRSSAAFALGDLGDARAFDGLLAALRQDQHGGVRGAAADGLGRLHDHRAFDVLVACLRDDPDAFVGERAAYALGELGHPRAVDALLAALDPDHRRWVRVAITDVLGTLGDRRALEPLVALLRHDRDATVRGVAAEALGTLGDARSFAPLLAALSKDRARDVRGRAAAALGALGDVRALDPLLVALRKDRHPDVQASAARALGALGNPRAFEPVLAAFRKGQDALRESALDALRLLSEHLPATIDGSRSKADLLNVTGGKADRRKRGPTKDTAARAGRTRLPQRPPDGPARGADLR